MTNLCKKEMKQKEFILRFGLFVLAVLCSVCVYAESEDSTKTIPSLSKNDSIYLAYVEKADSAIAKEKWADAEELLLTAMRGYPTNPTNVMLLSNLAIIQYQQGKDSVALASINDAYFIAPKSITVLNNRARIHKALGMVDEAYDDYQQIIDLDSTLLEPRYMHGLIAMSKSDYATAKNDFDAIERIDAENEIVIDAKATLLFYTQQYVDAIEYFTKLLKNNPTEEYYYNRVVCYMMTEQLAEASADIGDAMKLYPLNGELYLLRAWLNKLYYRHNDAEADAKRAIELGVNAEKVKTMLQISIK